MADVGSGPQGLVQALAHEYLGNGLLRQRKDGLAGVTEDFSYDALERLTRWQVLAPGQDSEVTYTHDDVGNLLARTERMGTSSAQRFEYRYGGNGGGPHAVTGYAGDSFRYDAVGRQTDWQAADGRWRHVEYTALGLPRRVQAQGLEVRYSHVTHVFHVQARGRPVAQVAWVEKPQGVTSSTVWLHEFTATEICSTAEGSPCASAHSTTWEHRRSGGVEGTGGVRPGAAGMVRDIVPASARRWPKLRWCWR